MAMTKKDVLKARQEHADYVREVFSMTDEQLCLVLKEHFPGADVKATRENAMRMLISYDLDLRFPDHKLR